MEQVNSHHGTPGVFLKAFIAEPSQDLSSPIWQPALFISAVANAQLGVEAVPCGDDEERGVCCKTILGLRQALAVFPKATHGLGLKLFLLGMLPLVSIPFYPDSGQARERRLIPKRLNTVRHPLTLSSPPRLAGLDVPE